MRDKIELSPCPHCGSDAELSARGVACSQCGASMEYTLDPGRVLAIEAWNARATLQPKPFEVGEVLKELAEASEAVNSHLLKIGTGDEWEQIWTRWRRATEEALRTQPQAPVVGVPTVEQYHDADWPPDETENFAKQVWSEHDDEVTMADFAHAEGFYTGWRLALLQSKGVKS